MFVHAGGDYQLGQTGGDGVAGNVQRFMSALEVGAEQLAEHRMRGTIEQVVLAAPPR